MIVVCTYSGWVECYPLDVLIPLYICGKEINNRLFLILAIHYGLNHQTTHLTAEINHSLAKTLAYSLEFPTGTILNRQGK